MKKTQKIALLIAVIAVVVIAVLAMWYFLPKTFLRGIEPSTVKSISVFDGNTGNGFVIDDLTEIKFIVENVQNIEMKKDKLSVGYSGYSFRMRFQNGDGEEIDNFIMNSENTIRKDPFFYKCNGGLCFDYLKDLEEKYVK